MSVLAQSLKAILCKYPLCFLRGFGSTTVNLNGTFYCCSGQDCSVHHWKKHFPYLLPTKCQKISLPPVVTNHTAPANSKCPLEEGYY
jgi:hypothetical protein